MKGLELSRKFYETYGAPMLHEKFPELEDKLAIGLVGDGSECFGYDDDISRDHDFEPGFCIFVPDDIDSSTEFKLERAYAKLPKSFEGVDRLKISPVGGSRHGVIKTGDFYLAKTGSRTGFDKSVDDYARQLPCGGDERRGFPRRSRRVFTHPSVVSRYAAGCQTQKACRSSYNGGAGGTV